MSRRPNFLFIGADKAGSSWLYEVLSSHRQVFVPPAKDLYFFDRFYAKGLDWYLGFFAQAPAEATCIGEICHDYLYSQEAAQRISKDLPGVRLMAFLREPVDRTFSHYLYMIRSGRTQVPFRQALDEYPELLEHSLYARHLEPYLRTFPAGAVRVFFYDDLRASQKDFARSVFGFLGIEWMEDFDYEKKVRPASAPRSFLFAKLLKQGASLVRSLGWANFVGRVKNSSFVFKLYKPYKAESKPVVSDEDRRYLQGLLAADIARLGELLDGPLPAWIRARSAVERAAS